jgi:hypothetical protein
VNYGPIEHTKTIIFAQGLGIEGYSFLVNSKKYKSDSKFRNLVDNMPHDRGLEPRDKIQN